MLRLKTCFPNSVVLAELREGETATIGRHPDNDVVAPHSSVSRLHATIGHNGADWYVRDMASLNGTFIGAARLPQCGSRTLRNGVHLLLGGFVMLVEVVEEPSLVPDAVVAAR